MRLGDVLEVMATSGRRFRSARASGRTHGRPWRFWWDGPLLYRFEDDHRTSVRNGAKWWTLEGTELFESDTHRSAMALPHQLGLLFPRGLLVAGMLSLAGEDLVAGRRAAIVTVEPRNPGEDRASARWWHIDGGNPFRAAVDLETGVVLRSQWFEVTEIAFDEAFDKGLFELPASESVEKQRSGLELRVVSLDEARAAVDFPVRLPTYLPNGASLKRVLLEPADPPRWVGFSWGIDPGYVHELHLRYGPGVDEERPDTEPKLRGGLEVIEQKFGGHRYGLWVRHRGIWFEVVSGLPEEEILAVIASIEAPP